MTETINLKDIQSKLYERLKPSGWADKLKGFLLSDEFYKILEALYKEAQEGKRFTPALKQLFRAFEECPYNELKVVMIGQDPYPYPNVADGIAFSCSNDKKIQASLRYIFKDIETNVYPNQGYTWDPDLARWSNQGVLLLNTALTTTVNKVGQHYILWQPFIAYVLDTLAFSETGLIYVFMGKRAQEWMKSVPKTNHLLTSSHPAFAAHIGAENWDSGNVFGKVNTLLNKYYGKEIKW
jgi:uracil-DNA glycosylase